MTRGSTIYGFKNAYFDQLFRLDKKSITINFAFIHIDICKFVLDQKSSKIKKTSVKNGKHVANEDSNYLFVRNKEK